ncbi:MAG: hypothetical protein QG608_2135, partial [Actinomycetota bacterium]|nr:hypothetical protein [Actinomycetota bacterium]
MTPPSRPGRTAGAALLLVAALSSCGHPEQHPPPAGTPPTVQPTQARTPPRPPPVVVAPGGQFAPIADLVEAAITAHRLPGAVVKIGHAGNVVVHQAFGWRKLDGEPGLDGSPSPAEPMTEDTIFDLASLTKILATTTAVLQLHEQGQVHLDDPVQTYLPEFNTADDPRRAQVTVRMLLTHTSGIGGDLSRQGPWGLVRADKDD